MAISNTIPVSTKNHFIEFYEDIASRLCYIIRRIDFIRGTKMKILSYFVTLLLVSSNILAASFDEADELFDRRGEGSEIIEKATRTYENLLKTNLPQEDVIYAVEQIGKLQSLRGQMIPEAQIRKRKPFFARCLEAAEKIAPSKLSGEETPSITFGLDLVRLSFPKLPV